MLERENNVQLTEFSFEF